MLRLTNIKKLGLTLKGPNVFPGFMPKRFFAAENEATEEKAKEEGEIAVADQEPDEEAADLAELESIEAFPERKKLITRVPLGDRARLDFWKKDLEYHLKHPNSGPFDFKPDAKQYNDENLTSLQEKAFSEYDAARDIKTKVGVVIRKLEDPDEESVQELCAKIHDLIHLGFQSGISDPITDRDFRFIIFHKDFQPFLKVFFNPMFFNAATDYIGVQEFNYILREVTNDPKYIPLIEFVKVLRSTEARGDKKLAYSLNLKQAKDFMDANKDTNLYNYMAFIYSAFNASKGSFLESIDFDEFSSKLVNLYWGKGISKKSREIFSNNLYDVLFVKLHIKENTSLQYFLGDMLLTAPSFNEGLEAVALTITIFARMLNGENGHCDDLFADFRRKFGEDKFNYYIKTKLPAIFNLGRKKSLGQQARKIVDNFVNTKNTDIKQRIVTIFDQHYYEYGAVIFYSHQNNTAIDYQTLIGKKKTRATSPDAASERELLTKATINGDNYSFLRLFKNEIESDFSAREIFVDVYSKYTRNPNKLVNLSPKVFPKFMNEFWNELEESSESAPYNKVQTTLTDPPKRTQDFALEFTRKEDEEGEEEAIKAVLPPAEEGEGEGVPPEATKVKAGARGFSTYIKKDRGLTYAPRKFFSGRKEDTPETNLEVDVVNDEGASADADSPFRKFVKKIEEVDKEVKAETKLSKEDVAKMKGILFEEGKKEGQTGGRDRSPKKVFTKPPKRERGEAAEREGDHDRITFSKISISDVPKAQAGETHAVMFASDYWTNVIGDRRDLREMYLLLENHFYTMTDLILCQSAIYDFVKNEPLIALGIQNGQQTLFKMFNQPELAKLTPDQAIQLNIKIESKDIELVTDPRLDANIETNYGKMSKDYNKYLKQTIFPFTLGDMNYRTLLTYVKENFKRLYFKRIVAHIAKYSTDISKENLALISDICYEQRIGLTLVEIAHLFVQNRVIHHEDQLKVVVERLKYFKDLADNCEYLARAFSEHNNLPFSINYILPHLELLMKFKKDDRFMPIFDRTKDYLNTRKLKYDENLSQEENLKKQEEFKNENRNVLNQFYRDFIRLLNRHGILRFSKLLYKEQSELKMINSIDDYVNGIYCYKENEEDIKPFVRRAKEDPEPENVAKLCNALLEVISEDPIKYQKHLEDINENLILTDKVHLNPEAINNVISSLMKAKLYPAFGKFLSHLIKKPLPMKSNTRVLCYRLLNASKDEISKPHLLGLVDKLFSEDVQQRMKERTKESKKKKEKVAETAISLEPEKPVEQEPVAEPAKKGKKEGKEGKKGKEAKEEGKEVEAKEEAAEKEVSEEDMYDARYSKFGLSTEQIFSRHHKRKVMNNRVNLQKFNALSEEGTETTPPESK